MNCNQSKKIVMMNDFYIFLMFIQRVELVTGLSQKFDMNYNEFVQKCRGTFFRRDYS